MRKRDFILLSVTIVAVAAAVATMFVPARDGGGRGPELSGDMQFFTLAKRQLPRPDVAWKDAAGRAVRLADFGGKVVLLNFWASWCAPCRKELPSIDRLQARLGGKDFVAIALNNDENGQAVAARDVERLGLENLPLYLDTDQVVSDKLGLPGMPTTFLFDRAGNLLGRYVGAAEWDGDAAVALIRFFIDRPEWVAELKGGS